MSAAASIDLLELAVDAIAALDPRALVCKALSSYDGERVVLLAMGKAALAMARGADDALGDRIAVRVIAGPGEGSHPIPDARSVASGRALLEAAAGAARNGAAVIALVSGGGSALAAVPAPGLTLADKRAAVDTLLGSGASIDDVNTVRKHLSAIKGGRLALAAGASPITTLIISDVVSRDPAMVASGPTLADPTTFADAARIARSCGVDGAALAHVEAGARGERADTPKTVAGAVRVLADNAALVSAVLDRHAGAVASATPLVGPIDEVASAIDAQVTPLPPGSLWVGGGEPTVALPVDPGRGGRAHHLGLTLARRFAGRSVRALVLGSDGSDGRSGGAGALVDGRTWTALTAAGIDGAAALERFDSATALRAVGASVPSRATGTNLADLVLVSVL